MLTGINKYPPLSPTRQTDTQACIHTHTHTHTHAYTHTQTHIHTHTHTHTHTQTHLHTPTHTHTYTHTHTHTHTHIHTHTHTHTHTHSHLTRPIKAVTTTLRGSVVTVTVIVITALADVVTSRYASLRDPRWDGTGRPMPSLYDAGRTNRPGFALTAPYYGGLCI